MNLNKLAKTITLTEGKKVSLPIGQIKEVMKIMLEELALEKDEDILKVIKRYR
jgi:predicted DNA-binding antitoxin AbrB/MazE fold protein